MFEKGRWEKVEMPSGMKGGWGDLKASPEEQNKNFLHSTTTLTERGGLTTEPTRWAVPGPAIGLRGGVEGSRTKKGSRSRWE